MRSKERRACARIEATTKGLDIRFVVTSIETGSAEHVYQTLYCARGQAENLIKLHKAQLASDRTGCRSPLANQMRLILHTAAYWLMLTVRDVIPKAHALAAAEFATLRLRLLKLGARIIERASRVRLAFACLPRRHFDPPHRRGADADGAVNDGAEIAPVNPSRKPPAPAPETPPSGDERAASGSRRAGGSIRSRSAATAAARRSSANIAPGFCGGPI